MTIPGIVELIPEWDLQFSFRTIVWAFFKTGLGSQGKNQSLLTAFLKAFVKKR